MQGSYNQGFLQTVGFLQPVVVTIRDLTFRGSYNQSFLQPGVFITRVSPIQGFLQARVLTTRVLKCKGSYNKEFLQARGLTTRGSYSQCCYNQGLLQLGVLHPGALTVRVSYIQGIS